MGLTGSLSKILLTEDTTTVHRNFPGQWLLSYLLLGKVDQGKIIDKAGILNHVELFHVGNGVR